MILRPILLIDDNPTDVALIRRTIERAAIRNPIIAFPDAEKAMTYLTAAAANPALLPAVVFADIRMPRVQGFDLLAWIRTKPGLASVAVVMLSGSEDPADREHAGRLGATDYLVKDPSPAAFVQVVERVSGLAAAAASSFASGKGATRPGPVCLPAAPNLARKGWREMAAGEHFVQVYEQDDALVDSLSEYIADGFWRGERSLAIATHSHRRALEQRLRRNNLDLSTAIVTGQYIALDAHETLAKIMVGDRPEAAAFEEAIGALVQRATQGGRALRVFGEMGALLRASGRTGGAQLLEELWSGLLRRTTCSLFCAHPVSSFSGDGGAEAFLDLCRCHARVIPPESFAPPASLAASA